MTPVRIEPRISRFRVLRSTTMPLRSLGLVLFKHYVVPSVGKTTKSLSFRNSSVESNYAYSEDGSTQGYYYLNNFDNIFISGGKNIFLAL